MIEGEKDYYLCQKILISIFADKELVQTTLSRFSTFDGNKLKSVNKRIQGLLHRCGNINAVKEFLTYLVFETYQEKENDFSYHLARLGFGGELNSSKVFLGMPSSQQIKLQKLMQWQVNRVKQMCDFICRKNQSDLLDARDFFHVQFVICHHLQIKP